MKKITIYYSMSNPSSNLYDQYTRKCVYIYTYITIYNVKQIIVNIYFTFVKVH